MTTSRRARRGPALWLATLALGPILDGNRAQAAPPTPAPAAAPAADPTKDAAAHYSTGAKAFEEGDFSKAVEELQSSIKADPTSKAYLLLGKSYVQTGQLDDAKSAFERYLQLEPKLSSSKRATIEKMVKDLGVLATTRFKITTQPPGATVFVDLKAEGPKGKTPLELPISPGPHRVMFELEGYDNLSQSNVVATQGQEIPVTATLKAKGCDVSLAITPAQATARVDGGVNVAGGPGSFRVTPGKHEMQLAAPGFLPKSTTFECKDYKPMLLSETLEAAPKGVLAVKAPAGASVAVDGNPLTADKIDLEPGDHKVDVTADGKAPWHVVATVRPGERIELAPSLDVGGAAVAGGPTGIEVLPATGGTVRVDGKEVKPGELVAAAPGDHTVEVTKLGHEGYRRTVKLAPGETLRLEPQPARRGMGWLALGIGATVLAAGAESLAIFGHVEAGHEVAGSQTWQRWHDVEIASQITAGALAAVAVTGYVIAIVQSRSGGEKPSVAAAVAPSPTGMSAVVQGSF